MTNSHSLLKPLRELHRNIRDAVVASTEAQHLDELSGVSREEEGDTIYAIDAVGEEVLLDFFEKLSQQHSFVLIAEGLAGGQIVFPRGLREADAAWRIIVDPID